MIDLKEVNDLESDNSLNVTLKINSEKIKLNLKKLKSISNDSRYTSDDIKRKIEDYKKSVISKRKSEEIKFNNDGNLYKIICFINTKPIKLQGVEKKEENYDTSNFTEFEKLNDISLIEINPKNYINLSNIKNLNKSFYQKLTEDSQTLPYIVKIDNYPLKEKKKMLNFIFELYQYSKNYKFCLVSKDINYFMKSFEDTYKILTRSGIHFPIEISAKKDEIFEKIDFIPAQKPKINELYKRDKTIWNDENNENLISSEIITDKALDEERRTVYREVENYKINSNRNEQKDPTKLKKKIFEKRNENISRVFSISGMEKYKNLPKDTIKLKNHEYEIGNINFMFEDREKNILKKKKR